MGLHRIAQKALYLVGRRGRARLLHRQDLSAQAAPCEEALLDNPQPRSLPGLLRGNLHRLVRA